MPRFQWQTILLDNDEGQIVRGKVLDSSFGRLAQVGKASLVFHVG